MLKVFIFDLDGTLYPRSCFLYSEMSHLIRDWFMSQSSISDRKMDGFFENLKLKHPSVLEAIQAYGLSLPSFHEFVFERLKPDRYLRKNKKIQHLFSFLSGQKFLVTFSSQNYSLRALSALGIDQFFSGIYNSGVNWFTCQKIDAYETIRTKCGLRPEEICIIGDNYEVDLRQAREAGYCCILVAEDQGEVFTISDITRLPDMIARLTLGDPKFL